MASFRWCLSGDEGFSESGRPRVALALKLVTVLQGSGALCAACGTQEAVRTWESSEGDPSFL